MSRFPEMQRVERALKSKEVHQLQWALAYCESRLTIDTDPQLREQWRALLESVRQALATGPA
jgi:hypothetical protein